MSETIKIGFHDIERCGYYKRGGSDPEFSDLSKTLSDLSVWLQNKPLIDTLVWAPADGQIIGRTCCAEMIGNPRGDFVVTTWNASAHTNGKSLSIKENSTFGSPEIGEASIKRGHITGYPAYHWFVPEHNVVATLKFRANDLGHAGVAKYVKEYLATCGPHCAEPVSDDVDGRTIQSYTGPSGQPAAVLPHFSTRRSHMPAEIEFLRNHVADIERVERRVEVPIAAAADEDGGFSKLLDWVGITTPPVRTLTNNDATYRVKYTLPYTPSAVEFEEIISGWHGDAHTKWENLGFRVKGRPSIIWLDGALITDQRSINVTPDARGVFSASDLLNGLTVHRASILATISQRGIAP